MNIIQWLSENPHAFTVFWALMGIVGGVLVWDVGRDE